MGVALGERNLLVSWTGQRLGAIGAVLAGGLYSYLALGTNELR